LGVRRKRIGGHSVGEKMKQKRMGRACLCFISLSRRSSGREWVAGMGVPLERFFMCYSSIWDPILGFERSVGDSLCLVDSTVSLSAKFGLYLTRPTTHFLPLPASYPTLFFRPITRF
jgi:hypothetical protein